MEVLDGLDHLSVGFTRLGTGVTLALLVGFSDSSGAPAELTGSHSSPLFRT